MDYKDQNVQGRVREYTPEAENTMMDQRALKNIQKFKSPGDEINMRLEELRNEWDIERYIEVNAGSLALVGILMGTVFGKKWFLLSGAAAGFLLQNGIQGWCPPTPLLRILGVRTRKEINEEKYALKVLRGDFDSISRNSQPEEILDTLRE